MKSTTLSEKEIAFFLLAYDNNWLPAKSHFYCSLNDYRPEVVSTYIKNLIKSGSGHSSFVTGTHPKDKMKVLPIGIAVPAAETLRSYLKSPAGDDTEVTCLKFTIPRGYGEVIEIEDINLHPIEIFLIAQTKKENLIDIPIFEGLKPEVLSFSLATLNTSSYMN